MGTVTCDLAISLDGHSTGPNQSLEHPFGDGVDGGEILHSWMFDHGDNHRAELAAITAAGAFIMGRNMFGPGRGAWDLEWKGWWGAEPPYHAPVFVLTHVAREPLEMEGGTTFHFVTGGPDEALKLARAAAGDMNVAVAGGVTTINQYLAAGVIDELRLHVVPVVLDVGYVRLFDGVGPITWSSASARWTPEVTHLVYRRRPPSPSASLDADAAVAIRSFMGFRCWSVAAAQEHRGLPVGWSIGRSRSSSPSGLIWLGPSSDVGAPCAFAANRPANLAPMVTT